MSVTDFEDSVKNDIIVRRLQALITGGVTVSDQEVRDAYRKQNIKIKFDYAVISADDLRKTINPSDSDLRGVLQEECRALCLGRAGRAQDHLLCVYAKPDSRRRAAAHRSSRFSSTSTQHQSEYSVPEQARSRHILISVPPGRGRQDRCRGQGQGRRHSQAAPGRRQLGRAGQEVLRRPGQQGLPAASSASRSAAAWCPSLTPPSSRQKIGDIKIVKSQFGYHIVQVEERNAAHAQSLNEVQPTIQATLHSPERGAGRGQLCQDAHLRGHQERPGKDRRGPPS